MLCRRSRYKDKVPKYFGTLLKIVLMTDAIFSRHLDDHLGGSNLDTGIAGEVLQITDYLPYGKERITQKNTDYKNKYGFIGKEKDNESGLNYVEARYYDSNLGRFVAQDKMFWEVGQTKRGIEVMADPQQMNSYSYARDNPIVLKDPSGESACDVSCWFGYAFNSAGSQGFSDINQRVQQEGKAYKKAGEIAMDTVLQNAPGTGDAGDAYAALIGKDIYTGEKVPGGYRVLMGVGAFIPGVSGGELRGIGRIVQNILKDEEVIKTLKRIESKVQKYKQDGTVFRNDPPKGKENPLLPVKKDGYYKEYTVDTPGSSNRGTKRIVTGQGGETYYSSDHYDSFTQIK